MKIINSAGGVLIGIHHVHLASWGGVFGCKFFYGKSSSDNDYDALHALPEVGSKSIIGIAGNGLIDVVFITKPLPTLIVDKSMDHIYLVQIDTSEEGWSESQLHPSDFEKTIRWQNQADFKSPGGKIIFFDSAGECPDRDNDHLSATLEPGLYTCDWARQKWEGQANMLFMRIVKKGKS